MAATDRSATGDAAAAWAAALANRHEAVLRLVQVVVPQGNTPADEAASPPPERIDLLAAQLRDFAVELAGTRGEANVIVDDDPARALIEEAHRAGIDTIVVGNAGMSGRKEFLLGNIPNRISHNATCTVIIVNTAGSKQTSGATPSLPGLIKPDAPPVEPHLLGRATHLAAVMAKHGLQSLFGHGPDDPLEAQRSQARRLRTALEELGPTFAKLGQILSTRADLLPPVFIEELSMLQDNARPLTEEEVVGVAEAELGVPWEDVFESIERQPMAAGTIAQVHGAITADGRRVVVKIQRPTAREDIMQDLALLEVLAEKTEKRPALREVVDMPAVFEHLSASLQRELDFRNEAANIERMRRVLEAYPRIDVPQVDHELTTERLLVMERIEGVAIRNAPDSPARKEAARQLLESFYRQIMSEGFFHADPHPGNLMWADDKVYLLDLGMVGLLDPDLREQLMLLLLAFWQEDVSFLTDVTLMLAAGAERDDLDVGAIEAELGSLMARYRDVPLSELQLGPILQEMTEISIRHRIPLPASMTLTAKAMAQMQLATGELDPDLDPFDVAGKFLMRTLTGGIREKINPQRIFYQAQKLKVRITRMVEAIERLVGARPGPRMRIDFGAEKLEATVRRAGNRLTFGLIAAGAFLGAAIASTAEQTADWLPLTLVATGFAFVIALLLDMFRRRD
jgi:predicted unusual protein kinase regulating ubiquinone biosynthesis (AarF/ABC1/UbiB family)/nucleotide-binding universal stress UspA family protein